MNDKPIRVAAATVDTETAVAQAICAERFKDRQLTAQPTDADVDQVRHLAKAAITALTHHNSNTGADEPTPAMDQIAAFRETIALAEQHGMPEHHAEAPELGLAHLQWMYQHIQAANFSGEKLGRWLGWAQCAVVATTPGVTLDDMKALNATTLSETR